MIDTEKYQPARQNMKFVTRSLRSLDNKLHILARMLIFSVSINSHPDNIYIHFEYQNKTTRDRIRIND